VDWEPIAAFVRAARASSGPRTEPPPSRDAMPVDLHQVMAYRASVQGLTRRLPHGEHVTAAFAGLQDSAPRAALYGLHARMEDVGPDDWEHASLVQIWFRLGADYVIPRDALDVFTVGTMPDEREQRAALNDLGELIRDVVAKGPMRTRDVVANLGPRLADPHMIRIAQVSGKIVIRWDARTTEVIASDDPATDPAHARVELARRFVQWFGPVGPTHLAKWAAMPKALARVAFDELDLVPADFEGRGRSVLASDTDALASASPVEGVRLLPGGADPFLYLDHDPVPAQPEVGPDVTQRLVNSLTGRILLDGAFVGAWGRVQNNVTLFPWKRLADDEVARIVAEAETFAGPLGGKAVRTRWLG
jgi:hypothetical protein